MVFIDDWINKVIGTLSFEQPQWIDAVEKLVVKTLVVF
jgi:hypothetical protein